MELLPSVRFLFFLPCLLICLCARGFPALGAGFPALRTPAVYQGTYSGQGSGYRVLLYLGQAQEFVLCEEIPLPNGKVSAWEVTGTWRQIRDGALLHLTNNSHFSRILNVGGRGDLYLDTRLPAAGYVAVSLRRRAGADPLPPDHTVSGILRGAAEDFLLEDADSGVVYDILFDESVAAFVRDHASGDRAEREKICLPVRAGVAVASGGDAPLRARIQKIDPGRERHAGTGCR
jgi:hypothetical protein